MNAAVPGAKQLYVLALFLGIGFLLGSLYELCRFFRRLFVGERPAAVMAQDTVFCAFSFFALFFALLAFSDGRLRPHLLLSAAAGGLAFRLTLGRPVRRALERLENAVACAGEQLLRPFFSLSGRVCALLKTAAEKKTAARKKRTEQRRTKKEKSCKKMKKASCNPGKKQYNRK